MKKTINMKKILFSIVLINVFLHAQTFKNVLDQNKNNTNKILQKEEQEKILQEQIKNSNIKKNKTYEMKTITIEEDKKEEICFEINKINVKNSTIFTQSDFDDIINPYLDNCNGIKNLSNLTKKISNMYIEKGYITSRAYLKGQDLSDGIINIDIIEGKIEKINSKNVNVSNLYMNYEDEILNVRDLEVAIQQGQRLKSQSIDFELKPGSKVGYSIVDVVGKKIAEPYYGDINMNNFGTNKTGKAQIDGSFNYENLFDINDIITFRLNITNHSAKSNNNTLGSSLSYSFPLGRTLLSLAYSNTKYKQQNKDEFGNNFQSDGDTNNISLGLNYKLFHSQQSNLELNSVFDYKNSRNYLNDVKLPIQSYQLSILNLGAKYTYLTNAYNYYLIFTVYKGMSKNNDFAEEQSDFIKYVLDMNFTKKFESEYNLKYNFSLRGQFSNNRLYGTEEISMGGPYSVRGFNEVGLNGNTGFYSRNELGFSQDISNITLFPYLALDYGYVKKDRDNIYGSIIGSSIGLRTNWNNVSFETFYSISLKDSELTKDQNNNFMGLKLAYNF